jgi:hypothetical protein
MEKQVMTILASDSNQTKTEDLGKRTIEGVECTGTRSTTTIAAGQVGNEREIVMITETWRSDELGLDLLRIHSDPRFGVTTYRVTRLERTEQPRSLFEPPANYKVETSETGSTVFHKVVTSSAPAAKNE